MNCRGQKLANATHRSVTDPNTRLARTTRHGAATLAYQASVFTENRHGLIVETDVRAAEHHAERETALEMLTAPRGVQSPAIPLRFRAARPPHSETIG